MRVRLFSQSVLLCGLTAAAGFAGTVSPQLTHMNPAQPVQAIIQYTPSLIGSLLNTVCGLTNLLELLPTG